MKKILILPYNYYPDNSSIGQLYKEISEYLALFYKVTVLCTIPNYTGDTKIKYKKASYLEEEINGVKIKRIITKKFDKSSKFSRLKSLITYFFDYKKVIKKLDLFDLVLVTSQPPIFGGYLARITSKKLNSKLVYNIQDFNPEQIESVGYFKNKFILKLLKNIDNKTIDKSDLIITVSNEMNQTLMQRRVALNKNVVINNWINENVYPISKDNQEIKEFRSTHGILDDEFAIMYSGNIGLYYDFEIIFDELSKFHYPNKVKFVFVGEGAMKDKLIDFCNKKKMDNFIFLPYQDKDYLHVSLNAADAHLVIQSNKFKGISFPSKLYGVLATNIPIIGIGTLVGDLNDIISKIDNSIMIDINNIQKINEKILDLINNDLKSRISNGFELVVNQYSKNVSLEKYKNEIDKLI